MRFLLLRSAKVRHVRKPQDRDSAEHARTDAKLRLERPLPDVELEPLPVRSALEVVAPGVETVEDRAGRLRRRDVEKEVALREVAAVTHVATHEHLARSNGADKFGIFPWSIVRQIGPVFCIPENKELLAYWARVEDRLYKIRHCMDISGQKRELALFAPEIDPGTRPMLFDTLAVTGG